MLNMTADANGIVTLEASGRIDRADFSRFSTRLERLAEAVGPLRLLVMLVDFHGWEVPALWDELRFDTAHHAEPVRIAVVGESTTDEWGTRLGRAFLAAEVRYFDIACVAEARSWLTRSQEAGPSPEGSPAHST